MKAKDKSTPQAKVQGVSVNTRLMWRWGGWGVQEAEKAMFGSHISKFRSYKIGQSRCPPPPPPRAGKDLNSEGESKMAINLPSNPRNGH